MPKSVRRWNSSFLQKCEDWTTPTACGINQTMAYLYRKLKTLWYQKRKQRKRERSPLTLSESAIRTCTGWWPTLAIIYHGMRTHFESCGASWSDVSFRKPMSESSSLTGASCLPFTRSMFFAMSNHSADIAFTRSGCSAERS